MADEDLRALRDGMASIAGAFRPVIRIGEGSRRLTVVGTSFALNQQRTRLFVTANHVLSGLEDKLVGIDEDHSMRWPRQFFRLAPLEPTLPDADIAWVAIEMFADKLGVGNAVPIQQALARVSGGDKNGYMAVGYPASRAKLVDAHTVVSSKLMMSQVTLADDFVCRDLKVDKRVQMAFSYAPSRHIDVNRAPVEPAAPKGMSGGAIVATTRCEDEAGNSYMKPFVVAVLTHYYPQQRTFVATRIEHLLRAAGFVSEGTLLYQPHLGSYMAVDSV